MTEYHTAQERSTQILVDPLQNSHFILQYSLTQTNVYNLFYQYLSDATQDIYIYIFMHTHKKRSVFIYMLEGQKYFQHIMFALQTIKKWTDDVI